MKYEIKEEGIRYYFGVSEIIDLNGNDNVPFEEIWNKTMAVFKMENYNDEHSPLGLEMYSKDFLETRKFRYAALMPVHNFENLDFKGLDKDKVFKMLPGKYIRFEETFRKLKEGIIPKIYDYIKENNIPVDYGFDYEEYPKEFDHQNPDSRVYVCFRYLGDE